MGKNKSSPSISNTSSVLDKYLNLHVSQFDGISNKLINSLAKEICPLLAEQREAYFNDGNNLPYFQGVFCADKIPKRLLSKKEPFTLIINLYRSDGYKSSYKLSEQVLSGHFIFLHFTPKLIYYLDPIGLDIKQKDVKIFIKNYCQKNPQCEVKSNNIPIQHMDSKACGLFSLVFVLAAENGIDYRKGYFKWHRGKKTHLNDKKCKEYLIKMVDFW
jgi:hypothetical protein